MPDVISRPGSEFRNKPTTIVQYLDRGGKVKLDLGPERERV